MLTLLNTIGPNKDISIGKVVYTTYNKYYIVFDILDEKTFIGINFHNYKESASILELEDVIEVITLPKNVNVLLFKKCEKIVEKSFENK